MAEAKEHCRNNPNGAPEPVRRRDNHSIKGPWSTPLVLFPTLVNDRTVGWRPTCPRTRRRAHPRPEAREVDRIRVGLRGAQLVLPLRKPQRRGALAADSFSSRALASPISKQTRAEKITPLLEDPRDARLRFRLYGFGWLFVACRGAAFAVALFTGYRFDWVFGAVLLPFGVALTWRSLRDIPDRRRFVLFIVRVALYGALLGAFASQYLGER